MAKHKVGVLEAAVSPDSTAPETYCGRAIAEYLVGKNYALKIGKRLIQMVKLAAAQAIELAKAAREAEIKRWERLQSRLGFGNVVPFSRPTDPGHHFHYEIPRANDTGIRRWGFRSAHSERGEKLKTRTIKVSARPRQSTLLPAIAAPTFAPRLAGNAFSQ